MTSVTSTSLQELIDRADARALAAAGLACLDRCLPLLAPDGADVLRPVWAAVARGDGAAWGEAVAKARVELADAAGAREDAGPVRAMLDGAPADWIEAQLRDWTRSCSEAALALHAGLDANGAGPLHAGELQRQRAVLESAAHGPTGLRRARDLSTEGGRVLRAVVSRRARTA
ncbi:hypothetical protein KV205_28685 [Streptomyces sp. SKN60]|uniref:hypothetical protein n=1 Tax=Streptomyces sp. SKN60 TaxID=2855506 RepID=UPI002246B6CD|nr:hypothetical protein [Streptomyces sp. SKN60]MCX2184477.1 hypothetical protein [Streptomyces sp. SKN60]